jgi:hypothetical protein
VREAPVFTHNGWFGFCPVKIADPYGGEPCLAARWWWLEPLFDMNEGIQGAVILLCSAMNHEYEPMWRIRVTGERK